MRVLESIDVLSDERVQGAMLAGSWAVLAVGLVAGVLLAVAGPALGLAVERVGLLWFLGLAATSVVALPVHEAVHALAFKLVGGRRVRVSFGFKDFMLYTSANGVVLPRGSFLVVLVAPTVVLSAAFAAAGCALGMPLMAWFALVVHLAGCTGDLTMAREVLRRRDATHVRDTSRGIDLLAG